MAVPLWAICPIEKAVFVDPVIDHEGNSYSRAAIEAWIELVGASPVTGTKLNSINLSPNVALAQAVATLTLPTTGMITPPPDKKRPHFAFAPPLYESSVRPCGRTSCDLACSACAMFCFCESCPPNFWPSEIYNAFTDIANNKLKHAMRCKVAFFFYANGAHRSKDMFHSMMRPCLSHENGRRYIEQLWKTCEARPAKYTSVDTFANNACVYLDGQPCNEYTPISPQKKNNREKYL